MCIGPEVAKDLLVKNRSNRNLREKHVMYLANEMLSGRWQQKTGDTIKFIGQMDELIDGQHRLHAVIKSGKTFDFYVALNCAKDAFQYIDVGLNRTNSDIVFLGGFSKNSTKISSLVIKHRMLTKKISVSYSIRPSRAVILEDAKKLNEKYDIHQVITASNRIYKKSRQSINEPTFGALIYCYAEEFGAQDIIAELDAVPATHPYILYCLSLKAGKVTLTRHEQLVLNENIFKSFVFGRTPRATKKLYLDKNYV